MGFEKRDHAPKACELPRRQFAFGTRRCAEKRRRFETRDETRRVGTRTREGWEGSKRRIATQRGYAPKRGAEGIHIGSGREGGGRGTSSRINERDGARVMSARENEKECVSKDLGGKGRSGRRGGRKTELFGF